MSGNGRGRTRGRSRCTALVAVRIGSVVARLRLGAVRHFVAGVAIALAGDAVDAVRGDALLEFLELQVDARHMSPLRLEVSVSREGRHEARPSPIVTAPYGWPPS